MKYIIAAIATILLLNGLPARAQNPGSGLCSYPPVNQPLTGTECFPVNQNGQTKTVTGNILFKNSVQGPGSANAGDAAIFNNTAGTVLADAGAPPSLATPNLITLRGIPIASAAKAKSVTRQYYSTPGDSPPENFAWHATYAGTPDNRGYVISPNGHNDCSSGCWVSTQTVMDVTQFGAVADGTTAGGTNNGPAFTAALGTGRSVYVPCGRYYIVGELHQYGPGQELHGNAPGQLFCETDLIPAPVVSTNFLTMGDPNTLAANNWIALRDLNITATNMTGVYGLHDGNAVVVNGGPHIHIERVNITNAWNAIQMYRVNTGVLRDTVRTALRGEYGVYVYGQGTAIVNSYNGESLGFVPVTYPTTSDTPSGAVIHVNSVTNIQPGYLVTGSANLPSTAAVQSVDPIGLTVTLSFPVVGDIPISTQLTFMSQTAGFWCSSYCQSMELMWEHGQRLYSILKIDDPTDTPDAYPFEVECFRCGDDGIYGTVLNDVNGNSVRIVDGYFYGTGVTSVGYGVYMGNNATKLDLNGGIVSSNALNGIRLTGVAANIRGVTIAQNSYQGNQVFSGIKVDTTASQITLAGNIVGYQALGNGTGRQRFGIAYDGVDPTAVFVDGNDLCNNGIGAIDNPNNYTLGTNKCVGSANLLLDDNTVYLLANLGLQYSQAHVNLIDSTIRSLKAAGIWSSLDYLTVTLGSRSDSLVNWVAPSAGLSAPAAVVHGTVGFTAISGGVGGLNSDGSTGWIDTGFSLTQYPIANCTLNSCSMFVGSATNPAGLNNSYDITSNSSHSSSVIIKSGSANLVTMANSSTGSATAVTSTIGIFGWSRGASGSYTQYVNSTGTSAAVASTAFGSGNMSLLGDGTAGDYSPRQDWFFLIGGNLTSGQEASLVTIMNNFLNNW